MAANQKYPWALRAGVIRALAVGPMLCAGSVRAQSPDSTQFHCDGKTITGIEIESQPPAIVGRDPSAVRRFMQHVLFQSGTTHESRIRAFLLAHVDQRCSDDWLTELARVVRAQPYIASASVTAVSDGADGVRLKVETVDEVPVVIGGGITKGGLSNVKYGNSNIGGTGLLAAGQWRDGKAYRDGLSLSMRQYGLGGQPVVAEMDAHREPLGGSFSADVSRPFLSDLEHIAWYMGGTHEDAYRPFVRASAADFVVPVARDIWSTGAVARFSWKSAGFLIGPVVTYEHARPGNEGFVASDSGLLLGDTTTFKNRYTPYRTFRGGLAAGVRWIDYMRVSGFDALLGEQDVARGFQLSGTIEHGFSLAQATDQSSLVSLNLYSGVGTPRSFIGLAMQGEELPAGGGDSWSAGVLSGRSAWYFKPSAGRDVRGERGIFRRLAGAFAVATISRRSDGRGSRLQRRRDRRRPSHGGATRGATESFRDRPLLAVGNGVLHRHREDVGGRRSVRSDDGRARERRREPARRHTADLSAHVARGPGGAGDWKRSQESGISSLRIGHDASFLA